MDNTLEETNENVKEDSNEGKLVFLAGFWVRFWAYLLDLFVVGSLERIIAYPVLNWLEIPLTDTSMISITALSTASIMYIYFIIMTKLFGQTLGKIIFGLKVIQSNEEKLSWGTVIFRELIGKFISKTVFFLGFIVIGFSATKKGWHDWFADTAVIQERKAVALKSL